MLERIKGIDSRFLVLFALFIALLNGYYNTTLPIYVDEAYYWLWGKNLDISYFDHPPMVAYMLAFFTIFSDGVFFVRLGALLSVLGALFFIYKIANEIYSKEVANLSAILFLLTPVVGMGFTIMTPDSPLILFWAGSLYFSYLAIFRGDLRWYILAGIFIGLGLLSKYTMVLFLGFLFIFLLLKKAKLLLSFKPWLSVFIAFLIFSPVLVWNYVRDWVSFAYQYNHGTSQELTILWGKFFEFFGGQFLLISPVFFAVLLYAIFKNRAYFRDDKRFFIALSFLFPLLFILYKALFKKMELNWGITAYVGGIIIVAEFFIITKKDRLLIFATTLSLLLVLVMKFPLLFSLEGKNNPHSRIFGFEEVYNHISPTLKDSDALMSDYFTTASIFSYFSGKKTYIPTKARPSQFDLWNARIDHSKLKGIYISRDDRLKELENMYTKVEFLEKFEAKKEGYRSREFYIYRIY